MQTPSFVIRNLLYIIKCCKVFVNSMFVFRQRQRAENPPRRLRIFVKDAHLQNFLSFLKKTLDFPGGGRYNKTRLPPNCKHTAQKSALPPNLKKVKTFFEKTLDILRNEWYYNACSAPVAQLDRVSDYESEGREFESLPAHHAPHRGRDASVHFLFVSLFSKRTNSGNPYSHRC